MSPVIPAVNQEKNRSRTNFVDKEQPNGGSFDGAHGYAIDHLRPLIAVENGQRPKSENSFAIKRDYLA